MLPTGLWLIFLFPFSADQSEEALKEKDSEMSKKEEEIADIQKRLQSIQTEKANAEEQLAETNQKLEDTDKKATEVCLYFVEYFSSIAGLSTVDRTFSLLDNALQSKKRWINV